MASRFVFALSLYVLGVLIPIYDIYYHFWQASNNYFIVVGVFVLIVGFIVNIYAIWIGYFEGKKRGHYSGWWKGSIVLLIMFSLVVILSAIA